MLKTAVREEHTSALWGIASFAILLGARCVLIA
jgi:hypothetical protein